MSQESQGDREPIPRTESSSVENNDLNRKHRYRLQQKLIFYGNDYWIENALGQRVFFVDGKSFFLREYLGFKDMQGNELVAIQEKIISIKDTYSIYRKGNELATVKRVLITPLTQRFEVHVAGAENLEVEGNIRAYEYLISEGHKRVAEVSNKWFPGEDTYGVNIYDATNHTLILAVTAIVDMMMDR